MGLNLNDKKAVVAEVSAKVASAQTIVVAEYRGIQVGHLTQLRAIAKTRAVDAVTVPLRETTASGGT